MESLGNFKTQQDARAFASKHKGNEAIIQNQNGTFGVKALNAQETKALNNKDFSKMSNDTLEFSIDVAGNKDRIVNKEVNQKFKTIEQAREAASKHQGNEAIVKSSDGTYKLFPFVDTAKTKAVEKRDFSKFDKNVVEISMDKPGDTDKIIKTKTSPTITSTTNSSNIGAKAQKMVDLTNTLISNIKNNKHDNNNYGFGDEYVNVAKGVVDADCSGFITAMLNKSGVDIQRHTAKSLGDAIRKGDKHLERITNPANMKPGDVITYAVYGKSYTGHVMMIMGKPEPITKGGKIIGYNFDVADSTTIKHTNDVRRGGSGVGTGKISVNVDSKGNMTGLHWFANLNGRNESKEITIGRIKE